MGGHFPSTEAILPFTGKQETEKTMYFVTERLQIRPITDADREAVLDLLTDKLVGKTYMLPEYQNRDEAVGLFRRLTELSADESRYVAGVYLDGSFIGMTNAVEIKGTQVEMGYAYLPDYYNRGYATEAFRGTIQYLFDQGFETVLAGAFAENAASMRVMEKSGMTRQDYTDEIEYRDVTHTCIYYAISK
jgi:RimJ/RimL family protein N-acetyltransferase